MNTKQFVSVFVLAIVMFGANALVNKKGKLQDKETVKVNATFDGYDADDGYAFLIKDEVDEGEEVIYFNEVTEAVLKEVNLKSDAFIGKRFEITYEITEYDEEDENGYIETFEKYTVVKIKAL
jgi:hypothetical protein